MAEKKKFLAIYLAVVALVRLVIVTCVLDGIAALFVFFLVCFFPHLQILVIKRDIHQILYINSN